MSEWGNMLKRLSDWTQFKADTWFHFKELLSHKAYWFCMMSMGLIIPLSGAFDTYLMNPLWVRIAYYSTLMFISTLGCALIGAIINSLTDQSVSKRVDLGSLIAIIWISIAFFPHRLAFAHISGSDFSLQFLMGRYVQALSFGFALLLLIYIFKFVVRLTKTKQGFQKFAPLVPEPDKNADVPLYIEADGHYVKLVRRRGVDMIRARLGEAAEQYGEQGFRCHKSYWVSLAAVDQRKREGRQMVLLLKDGTRIPVGRSYEKHVREQTSRGTAHIDPQG